MKHYGDIAELSGYDLPIVDVITGGSPCQDLSIASPTRTGLDGERSGLFMEQIRIIREMRERDKNDGRTGFLIRPRYLVWENVPGVFSSNGGKDFQAVLTEIVRIVEPDAPDVPLFGIGGGSKRWANSGCLYSELGGWSIAYRIHDAQFWGTPQRRKRLALVADFGGLSAPEILFERKGLSGVSEPVTEKRETAPQGTPDGSGTTITFRKLGHPRNAAEGQAWGGTDISDTLNAFDNTEARTPLIVYENHMEDSRVKELKDVSETVSQKYGTGGNNQPLVVCVGNGQTNQMMMTEQVGALNCMHDNQAIMKGNTVRRLTPTECERLQGFPDGWTDLGEWIDSKGKKHKPADSPRYRALGNSIATPFWFYLLRRISAQYERPATLGSLFDGIAGFPYCWARCNGSGSVLWASEIDEFCRAVCKRHFGDEETGARGDINEYL